MGVDESREPAVKGVGRGSDTRTEDLKKFKTVPAHAQA
jgi:hypothetical protein